MAFKLQTKHQGFRLLYNSSALYPLSVDRQFKKGLPRAGKISLREPLRQPCYALVNTISKRRVCHRHVLLWLQPS